MELSKVQLTTIVTLAVLIAAAVGGTITYNKDTAFYCEDRDLVFECSEGLSDSKLTCYYKDSDGVKRGKRCDSAWTPVVNALEKVNLPDESVVITVPESVIIAKADCVVHSSGCFDRGFIDRKIDCGACRI